MIRPTLLFPLVLAIAAAGCGAKEDPAPAKPVAAAGHTMTETKPSAGYALTTCPVSGHPLGDMGGRVAYLYDGTEVQFCCSDCIQDFQKDPDKVMAKVKTASK